MSQIYRYFAAFFSLLTLLNSLPKQSDAQPCKEVIGYYCNWQWYDRNKLVNPMTIPYSKYTIINYAFFNPQANGTILNFDSWADDNILLGPLNWSTNQPITTQSLPYQCHLNNVKLLVSIGGWTLSNNFPGIAADPVKRATFAHSCVQLIQTYNFDGIDIDWEYPGYVDHGGTSADRANFTLLLQQIKDSLTAYGLSTGKTYMLTAALPAGPSNMSNIDWLPVSNILDVMNIMTYDFFGIWDNNANHNSPLYAPQQGDPSLNCNSAMQTLISYGVPRSKLAMGIPFYGRSAKTVSAPALFGALTHSADNITFPEDDGTPLYYNLLPRMSLFTAYRDNQSKTPYLLGNGSLYTFVSYDDTASIALKAQYVLNNNLRGVIVWEITGDVLETSPGSGVIASTPLADRLNAVLCGGTVSTCYPPSGITASAVSASGATISWTAVSGNSYTVFWKRTVDLNWSSATASGGSYAITGLTACTSYQYKVRSDCPGGITAESAVQSFQTSGCCNVPTGASAGNITSSGATLTWTSTGAAGYSVQYKIATASTWTTLSVTTNSITLTGLTSCTGYQFQVASNCGTSLSAYSTPYGFQTTGCTSCLVPGGLSASSMTGTGAVLSWMSTGASSYSVRYRKAGVTTWTSAIVIQPSCTLSALTGCTNYEWQTGSICPGVTTTYSYIASFSTTGCTNTCATVPGSLQSTITSSTAVTLSWTSTGAAGYRIQYRLQSATSWTSKTTTGSSYSLSRLSTCSDYVWRVRAECSGTNVSQYSTTATFRTTGCTVSCPVPGGLAVSNINTGGATVSWSGTGATSYLLEYRPTSTATWTGMNVSNTNYVLTGLNACQSYEVRISANCSGTSSAASTPVGFQTVCCAAPTGLSIGSITGNSVIVSWSAPGAVSCNLQYKTSAATSWTTLSGVTSPFTLSGLSACTGYSVQVQSVCSPTASSAYTTPVGFTTTGCSSGGPAPLNYCSSYSLNSSAEYIQSFSVSNLTNVSGNNNGFGNFINMTADLMAGRSETLQFSPGFVGAANTEYWTVLIDFNRNGSFADAGEKVAQLTGTGTTPLSAAFTTPMSASLGGARMRVQMKRSAYASECDIYSYGEVEDYLVNIAAASPRLSAEDRTSSPVLYPNPAGGFINVRFAEKETRLVTVYDMNGRSLLEMPSEDLDLLLDLSALPAGSYILESCGISGTTRNLFLKY
ncbi:MAG: hypothetical protein RL213_121 [Bacteroidota bacterium]